MTTCSTGKPRLSRLALNMLISCTEVGLRHANTRKWLGSDAGVYGWATVSDGYLTGPAFLHIACKISKAKLGMSESFEAVAVTYCQLILLGSWDQ